MAEESHSALVGFLSDPATLVGLGVVAAGTAYYLSSRAAPFVPPVPLDNQTTEVPVSLLPHTPEHCRKSSFRFPPSERERTVDLVICRARIGPGNLRSRRRTS